MPKRRANAFDKLCLRPALGSLGGLSVLSRGIALVIAAACMFIVGCSQIGTVEHTPPTPQYLLAADVDAYVAQYDEVGTKTLRKFKLRKGTIVYSNGVYVDPTEAEQAAK